MRILGYMSGTSLDGVDAAILETDGVSIASFGAAILVPFEAEKRQTLIDATEDALRWDGVGPRPASFAAAEHVVLDTHLRAARMAMSEDGGRIDLVGFHGQTVLHRPERRLTVQLGDAGALATELGVPVVADLRQADLAAGGQGAPLVPIYHQALADRIGMRRPAAFLNIGGVANLSWFGMDGEIVAFDTGPGNGMIDLLLQSRGAGRYDEDGRLAAAGRVDQAVLDQLLAAPFFDRTGPKSLDRYDFSLATVDALSIENAAATLTAFTVEAVRIAATSLPSPPTEWIICGGGRHNPTLMRHFGARVGPWRSADDCGFRGDFVEAEAMAYLAARSTKGMPLTFPGTTGVPYPTTGGRTYLPNTLS
ncbi:anhydro-N-acetylmuramic acid kinase [Sphingomonas vulcanisoli]|uniref:Anhydro-N-acetylmuramic acid kinase n=1 Tax=Sphingomonas vulcanisoli TaxID=1658060 RepID=A0ABX0TQR9_9SPHN|nr:anhydro-N-acetylmuramic acid kinase [Sphingomonas vulcanisoli]NIJ06732.1 anhydro-N-acetylmuramic acid kinase [Sphingomonas vulcanisoli]